MDSLSDIGFTFAAKGAERQACVHAHGTSASNPDATSRCCALENGGRSEILQHEAKCGDKFQQKDDIFERSQTYRTL